jgi:hypothetical protein
MILTRYIGNGRRSPLLTVEGGIVIPLINKTGAVSVKGTLVNTEGSVDMGVAIVGADDPDIIGAIYQDGKADGDEVLVVIAGVAQVLLQDGTISTRGYWARVSATQAGRADITNAAPGGGTIIAIDGHFREIGHCLESKGSGTDVLAKVLLHFN